MLNNPPYHVSTDFAYTKSLSPRFSCYRLCVAGTLVWAMCVVQELDKLQQPTTPRVRADETPERILFKFGESCDRDY